MATLQGLLASFAGLDGASLLIVAYFIAALAFSLGYLLFVLSRLQRAPNRQIRGLVDRDPAELPRSANAFDVGPITFLPRDASPDRFERERRI